MGKKRGVKPPINSPIQPTPDQYKELNDKKAAHFNKRYQEIVAETGMCHIAVLNVNALGIKPILAIVPKNADPQIKQSAPAPTKDAVQ